MKDKRIDRKEKGAPKGLTKDIVYFLYYTFQHFDDCARLFKQAENAHF
jgi:hypothetical protein